MSLKGVKTMALGCGSAELLQVGSLKVTDVSLSGDLKLPNNQSLIELLNEMRDENLKLKEEVKQLKEKVDSFETE